MSKATPLITRFPSATNIFATRYKSAEELKTECFVSLDTNVLLAPYKLEHGIGDLEQITEIYAKLADEKRLVISGQVAREFADNRNQKLADLLQTLENQMGKLKEPIEKPYSCLRTLPEYEEALAFSAEVKAKQAEIRKKLKKVAAQVRQWDKSDPVWDQYRGLFANCIFDLEDRDLKEVDREFDERCKLRMPPGYKDAPKGENAAGDLIIWKTLLKVGQDKDRDLIFVTNDAKSDWWSQGNGGPLYPRFELVEEYGAVTNGRTIQILQFSEFLSLFGAKAEVIEEVERVEKVDRSRLVTLGESCRQISQEIMSFLAERQSQDPLYTLRGGNSPDWQSDWAAETNDHMRHSNLTMSVYYTNFHTRAVALARALIDAGLEEPNAMFKYEHPTNALGIREVATRLGVAGERLRDQNR